MQPTRKLKDLPVDWSEGAAWLYSPEIKRVGHELSAEIHRKGFSIYAYHEDAERRIQNVIIIESTHQEAREFGKWLCKRVDDIQPKRGLRAWLVRKLDR